MHFRTTLFALATAATAANAKVYGKWNVTISQYALDSGFKSQRLLADFVSDEYSGKDVIHTVCNYEYDPSKNPMESKSCDPPTFDYEYDGEIVKVQQNIEKPNKMTVFGDAPLTLKKDESVDGVYSNGVFIDADRAIA
ncbi:hypothetical protein J4E90_002895 [Alternaria incomplexa]|uniref:uncharacterized protein n=1 Tax=Alternaria incomplexa TaxID=1187928 RepID=UPI00222123C5|nr:uncharacterized protein J4E90_002895 [Alternaria incomplexa]XP_051296981.1 uncharacterized protein J4E86_011358 [Alternaria arbusti]KAI4918510.1 hypothetical protein J4E90_002895 [Alternaria incomplexa]KAI4935737.1 hypothetical protein J4E86_011358 [Alternaria arbusti]